MQLKTKLDRDRNSKVKAYLALVITKPDNPNQLYKPEKGLQTLTIELN